MSRELKFRAWDTATNRMLVTGFNLLGEVTCFDIVSQKLMEEPLGRTTLDRIGDVEIMQFTGLKDRNSKEIYEGDIISVEREHDTILVECKFGTIERQMATGFLVDITGFYFERGDGCQTFPIKRNYKGVHDLEVFEVVGNIHETPELLESNQ